LTGDLLYPLARRSTTHFANFTDKLLNTYYYFFNSFLLYKQVTAVQSATIKHKCKHCAARDVTRSSRDVTRQASNG